MFCFVNEETQNEQAETKKWQPGFFLWWFVTPVQTFIYKQNG